MIPEDPLGKQILDIGTEAVLVKLLSTMPTEEQEAFAKGWTMALDYIGSAFEVLDKVTARDTK